MKKRDKNAVLKTLKNILANVPTDEQDVKVYHIGPSSVRWIQLIKEAEDETELGRNYVDAAVTAAQKSGTPLSEYLNPAKQ